MRFFFFLRQGRVVLCLLGLYLMPPAVNAADDCQTALIESVDTLLQQALACNGAQRALEARWRSQQYDRASAGRLNDPRLMLAIAPQSFADNQSGDGYIIELSQPLPWFGVLSLRQKIAQDRVDARAAQSQQGRVNLAKQIRLAYAQQQYHRQLLAINRRHQQLWRTFIEVARTQFAVGVGTKSAVLKAMHARHSLQQEALELKAMLIRDLSELKRLGNFGAASRVELDSPIPLTTLSEEKMSQWLLSLNQQSLIQQQQARQRQTEHELSLAEKDRYPSFNVIARYNSLWNQDAKRWQLGVGLNMPFDLDKRQSREDSLRAEQQALRWDLQQLRITLREMLTQALSFWRQAQQVHGLYLREILPLARETLDAALVEYQSGQGDFLSLLNAESQLLSSERKALKALRDQYAQYAQLLAVTGVVFEQEWDRHHE